MMKNMLNAITVTGVNSDRLGDGKRQHLLRTSLLAFLATLGMTVATAAEDWRQLKFDGRHSGNVPDRDVAVSLGLIAAAPLTDAVFTAPVVADGRVYVIDGSGVVFAFDALTLRLLWKAATPGGARNCNNVSSPALAGRYLHFGTTAGVYYVLDVSTGEIVKRIDCGEPIFSAPVIGDGRVYFATLGSRVYALEPDGAVCWTWDFVQQILAFHGDRWSGAEWSRHRNSRVTAADQFLCSRDIARWKKPWSFRPEEPWSGWRTAGPAPKSAGVTRGILRRRSD
jgi:hypothetical protein